jgi:hypothetical protein
MAGADGQLRLSFTPSCKIWYLRSYVPTSIFFVVRDRREPSKRIPGVIPFLEQAHGHEAISKEIVRKQKVIGIVSHIWLAPKHFYCSVRDFTKAAKSRIRAIPKSQHGTMDHSLLHFM